jgi:hypothetical protein
MITLQNSLQKITGQQEDIVVYKPNGSAKRIVDWSIKTKLDKSQQHAFEKITASFILFYYNSALDICTNAHSFFYWAQKSSAFSKQQSIR